MVKMNPHINKCRPPSIISIQKIQRKMATLIDMEALIHLVAIVHVLQTHMGVYYRMNQKIKTIIFCLKNREKQVKMIQIMKWTKVR